MGHVYISRDGGLNWEQVRAYNTHMCIKIIFIVMHLCIYTVYIQYV